MKIKFNKNSSYKQNDESQSREYVAGEVYDVTDDHGQRWIRRGVAVEVRDEPKQAKVEHVVSSHARTAHTSKKENV